MNFLETTIAPKARGPIIKRILIRCPSTAKLTPSGQTIREDLWAKAKVKSNNLNCPHCGQSHPGQRKTSFSLGNQRKVGIYACAEKRAFIHR